MNRGLALIPGILLGIVLAAGTTFAAEIARPTPRAALPRVFLQTDYLRIPCPSGRIESDADPKGYRFDASLTGDVPAPGTAPTDHSPVALATEKDLAAVLLKTDGAITPYVGAGVTTVPEAAETPGLSDFEAEREADLQAYQLGAGLGCDLSHSARLNLGYRYSAGNLSELSGIKPNYTEPEESKHHLSLGLKLDF